MTATTISILATTLVGLAIYIIIAQRQKNDRIEKFFLAGRNIGINLFEHTTWATSNGSANGIWYAIWLGYTIGLAGIWLQSFWVIGIFLYSYLIPKIVPHSEKYTLHGFLGAYFGKGARLVASFVSLTGLFVCLGFEISYVSGFYTQVLGINKELIVPVIFAFSIFISVFCTIGGFSANAKTDKISNILATLSLFIIFFILLYYKYSHNIEIKDASIKPLAENPWSFYWGVIFFGLYQFVDMTNWQTVSANSLKDDAESVKAMQKKIRKAGVEIFFFPIVLGTIAGFMLKSITANISQETILSEIAKNYLPVGDIISIILLSIICFSFVAASLSATDSWLLASSQTISWDLTDYKLFNKNTFDISKLEDEDHQVVLRKAKMLLIIIGVVVTGFIYWVSTRWNQVFALQFVMFGAGLSMIPALIYGLFYCKDENVNPKIKKFAFASITIGFLTSIGIFGYSIFINDPNIVNHIPYVTLAISTLILLVGILTQKTAKS
jgi:sodium/proline symporter